MWIKALLGRRLLSTKPSIISWHEAASLKDEQFARSACQPLIVLHGMLGSKSNFRTFASHPRVATNRRVILADLRNHGQSFHSPDTSLQSMAKDVVNLIDHLELETCAILGHSLGGRVAMMAALQYPTRVSSLIVADIAPVQYDPSSSTMSKIREIVYAAADVPIDRLKSRKECEDLLRQSIPDPTTRQFVLQNLLVDLSDPAKPRLSWRANLPAIVESLKDVQYDWRAHSPSNIASVFIAGGRSKYISLEYHPAIKSMFVKAQIETIPDAGHWVHSEKLEEFAAICGRFLSATDSGR